MTKTPLKVLIPTAIGAIGMVLIQFAVGIVFLAFGLASAATFVIATLRPSELAELTFIRWFLVTCVLAFAYHQLDKFFKESP